MTLTESERLQARIAEMSNSEFDKWLKNCLNQAYNEGADEADRLNTGWEDSYDRNAANKLVPELIKGMCFGS